MHSVTHFVASVSLLLLIGTSIPLAIAFSLVFAVLIDLDILVGWWLGKPRHHGRTWVQEPFGVLLLGVPLGLLAQQFYSQGFLLVTIPYASHIILDYLSMHEVTPLAPFGNTHYETGVFRRLTSKKRNGISELIVLIPLSFLCAILIAVQILG